MPQATSPLDTRISYTPQDKYRWQVFLNNNMFADLTGLCDKRRVVITRNDSDQISASISIDKLAALASALNVNINDIFQSWSSEIRVSRYGTVLSAGELHPWTANIGSDRKINFVARGWFELLKWRRVNATYTNTSALSILQTEFTNTLARPYGNSGNYNGMALNLVPGIDSTNVYSNMQYDQKTLYDMIQEMTQEHNGFDIEFTWDRKLNIFYPYIGVPRPDIVFTYPNGNVKDIGYSVDPGHSFNSLTARGKGNGTGQNQTTVSDTPSQQEHGLREDVLDYTNITDTTALQNAAQADQNIYKEPLILHSIMFDGTGKTGAPVVGSFHVGDLIQIVVKNFKLYADVNQFFRIDQIQIDIGEHDEEDVTLQVSLPGLTS